MASQLTHIAHGFPSWAPEPVLESGDHLSQAEFHARYARMAGDVKAELIDGVVYMQAPLKRAHGRAHCLLMRWLGSYEDETPGVEAYDNATAIMNAESEPQPDGCLIIAPDRGGQTRFTPDDYLQGAPELIGEVASSTESIDLHAKKLVYETGGVKEYVVVALRQQRVVWLVHRAGRFEESRPDASGNYRSETFPGLWLDPAALLAYDGKRVLSALRSGMSTAEHAAFVQRLAK